ncbi:MAG: hypothetical protein EXS55_01040 [Candidatus Magasanikbacteria bacterium]|nr:hypothetical protein [Candidatus Magasanikbacteria bacterium]
MTTFCMKSKVQNSETKLSRPAVSVSQSRFFRRLSLIGSGKEKDNFVENFAMLVSAGMDVLTALEAIKTSIQSKPLQQVVFEVQGEIEAGSQIWRAFEKSGLLPLHITALIKIGEEAGTLSHNLNVIVEQQRKEKSFRSKMRSAMMYPLFVLGLALVVGLGIAWFILPRLTSIFTGLNIPLPFITRVLMAVGIFLGKWGSIVIPFVMLVIALGLYFLFIFPATKFIGQAILFHTPGVNRLLQEVELGRFGYILGTLLEAGLPVTAALIAIRDATVFRSFRRLYTHLHDRVEEGNSFRKSFSLYRGAHKLFPVAMQQLIGAGEQSGKLPGTLLNIGAVYEAKTELTTKNLTVILEPILLVTVWLGVVAVALSVILPIYSLIGGLSQSSDVSAPQPATEETSIIPVVSAPAATTLFPATVVVATSTPVSSQSNKLIILPTEIGYLKIRREPSTKGEVIGKAQVGSAYSFQAREGDWYQIVLPDAALGWVSAKYVNVVGE